MPAFTSMKKPIIAEISIPSREAKDTYLVANSIGNHTIRNIIPNKGLKAKYPPNVEETPFPPLNFKNME